MVWTVLIHWSQVSNDDLKNFLKKYPWNLKVVQMLLTPTKFWIMVNRLEFKKKKFK